MDMVETFKTKILNYVTGIKDPLSPPPMHCAFVVYVAFNERAAISREGKVLHLISWKKLDERCV